MTAAGVTDDGRSRQPPREQVHVVGADDLVVETLVQLDAETRGETLVRVVREHLDGAAGWSPTLSQVVVRDAAAWERYRARIEAAARSFETR